MNKNLKPKKFTEEWQVKYHIKNYYYVIKSKSNVGKCQRTNHKFWEMFWA